VETDEHMFDKGRLPCFGMPAYILTLHSAPLNAAEKRRHGTVIITWENKFSIDTDPEIHVHDAYFTGFQYDSETRELHFRCQDFKEAYKICGKP
jgi:hypothetical protein